MIGKAIHKILKTQISDLSTGGVFPVVIPQNTKYKLDSDSAYPSIIYHQMESVVPSKDKNLNILKCELGIQVVSKSYKDTDELSKKVKYLLSNYVDFTESGLGEIKGYTDENGYVHSFIKNIEISNIFFVDENDEYDDELYLFIKSIDFDVYYYNNINQFSYGYKKGNGSTIPSQLNTSSTPLILSLDCTQIIKQNRFGSITNKGALMSESSPTSDVLYPSEGGDKVQTLFNKIGEFSSKINSSSDYFTFNPLLTTESADRPSYNDTSSSLAYLQFTTGKYLRTQRGTTYDDYQPISLANGGLIVLIYQPLTVVGTSTTNNIIGNQVDTSGGDVGNLIISHSKDSSGNIKIDFNPCGDWTQFSSRTINLVTSTDSTNYFSADVHFLALSLGGNKAQTGGTYNQSGWFEYFNSVYNPKLTTGQIIKNNSFSGNSDTYSESLTFASIGGNGTLSGFNLYEMLLFQHPVVTTHNLNADAAPFQPTDIIYKKIKDYVYNKYNVLK
tara:strand:- start:7251 stop:8753 length:1503 start_codon:yes stop_codon:yes gene_type:complete